MSPENQKFLEGNRHHWITLRDAFYLRMIDGPTRSRMVEIMRQEFRPGYTADLWCPTCCANMVKEVYYEFEKWEAAQIPMTPIAEPEEPIKPVKANFPSNKKK